jgi:hypothetical protein
LATKKTQLISLPKLSASLGLDLSIIFLVILAILTYNTPLLILPFILIGLPIYFGIKHWRNWLVLWLGLLVVTGSGFYGLSQLFGQKSGITIFSDPAIWAIYVTARPTANLINQNWWGFLSLKMCQNFWSSIGPNFLVSHGGSHPWHSLPDIGHIYWSSYILGWIGLITTFARAMRLSRTKFWLWCQTSQAWWLYLSLISLAPAVITVDAPHATRSLIFLVLTQVWAVIGLTWLWRKVVKFFPNLARLFLISIIAILASETTRYYHAYFSLYPVQQQVFQPGLPETIQKINLISLTDPVAVVGDGYSYINWAWYLKMPAAEFFRTVIKQQPDRIGFKYGQQIGRYHFISNSADRVASEKILVQWQELNWKIQIF